LRQNSNFLTPKLGITSADTWTASAMIVRNLILNWIVILPVICAILLALKLYLVFVAWLADPDNSQSSWFIAFGLASPFLLAFALRFTTRNRPTRATDNQHTPAFWGLCLFPTLLAAAFLSAAIGSSAASSLWSGYHLYQLALACGCLGAAIYAVSWIAAWPKKLSLRDFLIWSASGLVVGALIGLGLRALDYVGTADCLVEAQLKSPAMLLLVVFGVPWILTSQMIAEMIFVGLTSYQKDSDADRNGWPVRRDGISLRRSRGPSLWV
jgi:hypothetical protein